jgi:hypothetical protein
MNMKWIFLSACGCLLFFTSGCLSSGEEWRGHANNARLGGIALGPSAIEVWSSTDPARPPEIIAR